MLVDDSVCFIQVHLNRNLHPPLLEIFVYFVILIGIFAIWYQVTFVLIAALGVYHFSSLNGSVIMVVAVLFSRTGLWLFDLCARQISQETIPEDSRGVINGQWASLTSFFNFGSYALACVFSGTNSYSSAA